MYGETGDKVVQLNIDGINTGIAGIVECAVPAAGAELEATGAFAFEPPERPGAQGRPRPSHGASKHPATTSTEATSQ